MGLAISKPLPRPPVPEGKTRLCVAGFGASPHTGRARAIVDAMVKLYPDEYESWYYFDTRGFRPDFLNSVKATLSEEQQNGSLKDHKSSPFCWIETPGEETPVGIGGRDRLCEWVPTKVEDNEKNKALLELCNTPAGFGDLIFDHSTPGTAATE
jgi:hypothetical protein